ncbi:unnamed protein product [Amoebophrya sp. A120]|nr:unnamed protein product [Amoebophrya sp. A120]|eukprot:GSA120T00026029001.1
MAGGAASSFSSQGQQSSFTTKGAPAHQNQLVSALISPNPSPSTASSAGKMSLLSSSDPVVPVAQRQQEPAVAYSAASAGYEQYRTKSSSSGSRSRSGSKETTVTTSNKDTNFLNLNTMFETTSSHSTASLTNLKSRSLPTSPSSSSRNMGRTESFYGKVDSSLRDLEQMQVENSNSILTNLDHVLEVIHESREKQIAGLVGDKDQSQQLNNSSTSSSSAGSSDDNVGANANATASTSILSGKRTSKSNLERIATSKDVVRAAGPQHGQQEAKLVPLTILEPPLRTTSSSSGTAAIGSRRHSGSASVTASKESVALSGVLADGRTSISGAATVLQQQQHARTPQQQEVEPFSPGSLEEEEEENWSTIPEELSPKILDFSTSTPVNQPNVAAASGNNQEQSSVAQGQHEPSTSSIVLSSHVSSGGTGVDNNYGENSNAGDTGSSLTVSLPVEKTAQHLLQQDKSTALLAAKTSSNLDQQEAGHLQREAQASRSASSTKEKLQHVAPETTATSGTTATAAQLEQDQDELQELTTKVHTELTKMNQAAEKLNQLKMVQKQKQQVLDKIIADWAIQRVYLLSSCGEEYVLIAEDYFLKENLLEKSKQKVNLLSEKFSKVTAKVKSYAGGASSSSSSSPSRTTGSTTTSTRLERWKEQLNTIDLALTREIAKSAQLQDELRRFDVTTTSSSSTSQQGGTSSNSYHSGGGPTPTPGNTASTSSHHKPPTEAQIRKLKEAVSKARPFFLAYRKFCHSYREAKLFVTTAQDNADECKRVYNTAIRRLESISAEEHAKRGDVNLTGIAV